MPGWDSSIKRTGTLLGLLLLGCGASQGGAKGPDGAALPQLADPTAEERGSLEAFTRLGWAIYQHDVAAAKGTDAMMALTQGKPDARVGGWVTLETSAGHRVQFVAPVDTRLLVVYDVEVPRAGDPRAMALEPPVEASPEAALQFRAREAVLRHGFRPCTKRYNMVVLPGALLGERGHLVYALGATTEPNEMIVGGHYRFLVNEDASAVLKEQPLSKGCMTLERQPNSVGLMVSSLVMPLPNESHFFVSLLYRVPLFVLAGGKLWEVDPGDFGREEK